ncbi:MAG: tyrosine-type recombinase/integrase [Dehalococcoidia bacterium]
MGSNPISSTKYIAKKFTSSQVQKFTTELLEKFISSRPEGLSKKTIEFYRYTLTNFVGYPLSPDGVGSYLKSLTCGNAKLRFYQSLKILFRWLQRNGYISENPMERVSPPKVQKKLLSAITEEQLQVLLEYCQNDRDVALISFLWHSGVRVSEAARVRAKDFNWGEGTVIVLGKGNRYRKALAGDGIVKDWFSEYDSFGLTSEGIQTVLKILSRETGIHCNPHSFRRGFAVHLVKSGLSTRVVQSLGGWETIAMVERYTKSLTFNNALQLYKQVISLED